MIEPYTNDGGIASMAKKGVIYILTNPSFKEYVKIGYATDIEKRLRQLNRSETIPFAFRVYATYDVDTELTDKELHRLIDMLNPDLRTIETFDGKTRTKEFYAMSPEEAYSLLECIAKISGTGHCLKRMKPEGHEIMDEKTAIEVQEEARRGPFRFSAVGIQEGSKVQFIDDPSIEAIVLDDRHVEYHGETTSLSALAKELKGLTRTPAGPMFFLYDGETLSDRRNRMEKEANNNV